MTRGRDRRPPRAGRRRASVGDTASTWLREHGHTAWMLPEDAAGSTSHRPGRRATSPDAADLVLSLGGDGTMLRAVGAARRRAVPLLGVNLGQLGYLTEVEADGMVDALERFVAGPSTGGWHLDERMMLDVDGPRRRRRAARTWRALNEAVVEKRDVRPHRAACWCGSTASRSRRTPPTG